VLALKWGQLGTFLLRPENFMKILREISFGDSRSAKYAILTHLKVLKFDFHEFLHF